MAIIDPTWQSPCGSATLYLGDCLEVLPTLGKVDAVVTDPPYGIDLSSEESGNMHRMDFEPIVGDKELFDPNPFMGYRDVLLWGANHFCHAIPPRIGQWYFWDKVTRNDLKVRIAEGEFAWHKCGTKPRAFRHLWSGGYRASETDSPSVHPTQKAIMLLEWCIGLLDGPAKVILDPFTGSGTTGVAAIRLNRRFIGIEIDPGYFQIAKGRIQQAIIDRENQLPGMAALTGEQSDFTKGVE